MVAVAVVFTATAATAENPDTETQLEKLRLEAIQLPVEQVVVETQIGDVRVDASVSGGKQNGGWLPCDATGQQPNGDRCILVWKRVAGERDVLTWVEPKDAGSHRLPVLGADGKLY